MSGSRIKIKKSINLRPPPGLQRPTAAQDFSPSVTSHLIAGRAGRSSAPRYLG